MADECNKKQKINVSAWKAHHTWDNTGIIQKEHGLGFDFVEVRERILDFKLLRYAAGFHGKGALFNLIIRAIRAAIIGQW